MKKPRVTDEMFVGSVCDIEYYIVAEKMHAGKNFGKICLQGGGLMLNVGRLNEGVVLDHIKAGKCYRK